MADEDDVTRCCRAAEAAAFVESGKSYAVPFLESLKVDEYCNVVENNLQIIKENCRKRFYRTRAIFKSHVQSIQERCEGYNGDRAEITECAKKLVQGLMENFDKFYNENKGVEDV